jgi:hypothetical protein
MSRFPFAGSKDRLVQTLYLNYLDDIYLSRVLDTFSGSSSCYVARERWDTITYQRDTSKIVRVHVSPYCLDRSCGSMFMFTRKHTCVLLVDRVRVRSFLQPY